MCCVDRLSRQPKADMERWLGYLTGNSSASVARNDEVDAPIDVQAFRRAWE